MVKVKTFCKQNQVCKDLPCVGKHLHPDTPKTSLLYQLIPNLKILVDSVPKNISFPNFEKVFTSH